MQLTDFLIYLKMAVCQSTGGFLISISFITSAEVLFTGIKVIDLIEPYAKGQWQWDYSVVLVSEKQY